MKNEDGTISSRVSGTPQGGVVSPILANLFLHYSFDAWVRRELPGVSFCRYADDGLLHCKSQKQAKFVMSKLTNRLQECGLEFTQINHRLFIAKIIIVEWNMMVLVLIFLVIRFGLDDV